MIVSNFFSGQLLFKTIHPVAFKHNLEQIPSLYLISTLSFEPRFVSYVHQQRLIYKKQTPLVLGLLVLLLCRNFSGISGNLEKKNILQIIEQLIQFSYLLLLKEMFLVHSFSEQVAAKGNSPETI